MVVENIVFSFGVALQAQLGWGEGVWGKSCIMVPGPGPGPSIVDYGLGARVWFLNPEIIRFGARALNRRLWSRGQEPEL